MMCTNSAEAGVIMIADGTPSRPDESADMRYVEGAACEVARTIRGMTYLIC